MKAQKNPNYKGFRSLKKWKVMNSKLYNLMVDNNIRPTYLAELCKVDLRTVERWIYEGSTPNAERRKTISELFHKTEDEIFS